MIAKLKNQKGEILLAAVVLVLIGTVIWMGFQLYVLSQPVVECQQPLGLPGSGITTTNSEGSKYQVKFDHVSDAVSITAMTEQGTPESEDFGDSRIFTIEDDVRVLTVIVKRVAKCSGGIQSVTYVFLRYEDLWHSPYLILDEASDRSEPIIVR